MGGSGRVTGTGRHAEKQKTKNETELAGACLQRMRKSTPPSPPRIPCLRTAFLRAVPKEHGDAKNAEQPSAAGRVDGLFYAESRAHMAEVLVRCGGSRCDGMCTQTCFSRHAAIRTHRNRVRETQIRITGHPNCCCCCCCCCAWLIRTISTNCTDGAPTENNNNLHIIFDTAGEGNVGRDGGGVLNVILLVAPVQNLVPM